jgi:drug/metabolite transporter (DMT)-like permease
MAEEQRHGLIRTSVFTTLSLVAFAANSVLCRLALKGGEIDAASFTVVRLLTGAAVLFAILQFMSKGARPCARGSWAAAAMLFVYAAAFSYAYLSLDTGTGALVLFGAVQISIVLIGRFRGNRLGVLEWSGMVIAFGGLVYLVKPSLTTPSVAGFVLMALAGVAWGGYTLSGKGSLDPLAETAFNFGRTIPMVAVLAAGAIAGPANFRFSVEGLMLAALSGGVASGIGYTLWYTALGGLSTTESAAVQLAVPVIAAFGGVLFVSEQVSERLLVAAVLTLGGMLLVILRRHFDAGRGRKPKNL